MSWKYHKNSDIKMQAIYIEVAGRVLCFTVTLLTACHGTDDDNRRTVEFLHLADFDVTKSNSDIRLSLKLTTMHSISLQLQIIPSSFHWLPCLIYIYVFLLNVPTCLNKKKLMLSFKKRECNNKMTLHGYYVCRHSDFQTG